MARPKSLETIIKEADGLSKRDINKLKRIYDKLGANFAAAAAAELSKKSKVTGDDYGSISVSAPDMGGDWVVGER